MFGHSDPAHICSIQRLAPPVVGSTGQSLHYNLQSTRMFLPTRPPPKRPSAFAVSLKSPRIISNSAPFNNVHLNCLCWLTSNETLRFKLFHYCNQTDMTQQLRIAFFPTSIVFAITLQLWLLECSTLPSQFTYKCYFPVQNYQDPPFEFKMPRIQSFTPLFLSPLMTHILSPFSFNIQNHTTSHR